MRPALDIAALPDELIACVRRAIAEDLGAGDVTTDAIVPDSAAGSGLIFTRQAGVIAGLDIAHTVFQELDPQFDFSSKVEEGERVEPGQALALLSGRARTLLRGERAALNFLGRMSGIATLTRRFVDAVAGTKAIILDTRKTAPGLRAIDKLAVRRGGGQNHRLRLDDMVLIKDNHIDFAGSLAAAVRKFHLPSQIEPDQRTTRDSHPDGRSAAAASIEVEVRTLDDLRLALDLGVRRIMLDNMSLEELSEAARMTAGRAALEASGGVTLERVIEIARTGVDYISVGALTHSAPALDVSLRLLKAERGGADDKVSG